MRGRLVLRETSRGHYAADVDGHKVEVHRRRTRTVRGDEIDFEVVVDGDLVAYAPSVGQASYRAKEHLEGLAGAEENPRDRADEITIMVLVGKYMELLGTPGDPPTVHVRRNLGSRWLGMWTGRIRNGLDVGASIEIQASVLKDPRTLERVVAHEVVHHHEWATMSHDERVDEAQRAQLGLGRDGHGVTFRELAARVNAVAGENFVTRTSDQEYVQAPLGREFLLLISPYDDVRLGWQWAARLGPKAKGYAERQVQHFEARLVRTQDERWTKGPKIGPFHGWAIPNKPEDAEALKTLFDAASAPARANPKREVPPGMTIKKAKDFSETGNYLVTYAGKRAKIFRDPESTWWYVDGPGHFSERRLGFNMNEALAKLVRKLGPKEAGG